MDAGLQVRMYTDMLRIRRFEEVVCDLFARGRLPGFYHLYIGEEAVAVGACAAINPDDYITSTHRGHGHVLAKGADTKRMMAELYAKATGYNKAKGGSMHLAAPEIGILGANGIVGGGIPLATGAALSAKFFRNGRVAVCFFGDGGSNQGTFHESINIASAFSLPCVYVCENNLYGVGTRQGKVRKVVDIADRAQGYAIPGTIVDGNDVEAVYAAVKEAVDRARAGEGPTLIECKTYRHRCHFEGEPDTYRPPQEVADWKARDPIKCYAEKLTAAGVVDVRALAEIAARVEREMEEAVAYGEESPYPPLSEALTDIYA